MQSEIGAMEDDELIQLLFDISNELESRLMQRPEADRKEHT